MFPKPENVKDVQAFLGLANYYRKLIKNFSDGAGPLTDLTKKDVPFYFGDRELKSFNLIKERLCSADVLAIYDPEKEAILETDASDYAIGACLAQNGEDGKRRVELLAVVEALRQWRVYLEGAKYPVQIYSDHKNLLYWTSTKELNRRQVRWSEVLASYDFRIQHVRGNDNKCADALSRRTDYEQGSKPTPAAILQDKNGIMTFRKQQTDTLALMEDLNLTDKQKLQVIQERHDNKLAGHPGISKTIELITRDFKWPGLRKDVQHYVDNCDTCKKAKHSRHKPYGLLQPPAVPNETWTSIAMDFITKLPKSKDPLTKTEYDSIFVVVDRLSGFGSFEPYLESSDSEALAYSLMRNVFSRFGTPQEIISDRGTLFTSQFWQSLSDQLGIKHKLSTAYHPQTDGQTERTNQTLEQYLRCYVNYEQNNWVSMLPTAQFAFNNAPGPTGISPFYANYGKHPEISRDPRSLKPVAEKAQGDTENISELSK
ncbi:reverse transcriptase domain protein [Lasallia pustulata]|uniref:Reverse transcriptase domain protein n=1 Tax=Lasallia pustulata TaxID=136370 RepID=A0A1W5DBA1_9LECA|nr:reverse transcriptase domain protein [Lasallia pustulata]